MKKLLCIVVALFMLALLGCSSSSPDKQTDDYYRVNRTGITEVIGTSQMFDPVKNFILPSVSVEKLLKQIDDLCLQPTGIDDDKKGWEYYFVIKYDDGSTVSITLSEGRVTIDGEIYKTTLYQSNDFAVYFENPVLETQFAYYCRNHCTDCYAIRTR